MNEVIINSLYEYIRETEIIKSTWKQRELWYRGMENTQYKLTPSFYRSEFEMNAVEEYKVFNDFTHQAKVYTEQYRKLTRFEWYSIMQHYGLPTRLLDWSFGSLIALYFAIRNTNLESDRAVWIIDPDEFNQKFNRQIDIEKDKNYEKNAEALLSQYLPNHKIGEQPLALVPPHIDKRIIAQKSRFTLHGSNRTAIEDICNQFGINIAKITIPEEFVYDIKMELVEAGISESVIFPDLEGLAREFIFRYVLD